MNLPILSITFLHDNLLLAANGPYLLIYNTDTKWLIKKQKMFHKDRIHGIKVSSSSFGVNEQIITCWGARCISWMTMSFDSNQTIHIRNCKYLALTDWVKDVELISNNNSSLFAILLAQNVVQIWNTDTQDKVLQVSCESTGILYSGKLFGTHISNLQVLCGTPLGSLFLWSVVEKGKVLKEFQGHKSPIHACCMNDKHVFSSSEDRIIRIFCKDTKYVFSFFLKIFKLNFYF
jgi:WD40 repeat protein